MPGRSQSVGDAGTFYVAARLATQQCPVALTSAGAWRTDLMAQVSRDRRPVAIQVKTKSVGSRDFTVNITEPAKSGIDEWVVLVALMAEGLPDFYVIPRNMVVAICLGFELAFGPAKQKFLGPQEFAPWKGNWEAMAASVAEAPWQLPQWIFDSRHEIDPDGRLLGIPDDTKTFPT